MRRWHLAAGGSAVVLLAGLSRLAAGHFVQSSPVVRVLTLGPGAHPGARALDARSGHGFLSLYHDRPGVYQVGMLDTATGAPRRTSTLPYQPNTLAVDARHSRLGRGA